MHALDRQSLHEVAYALLLRAPTLEQLDAQTHRLRAALGSRLKLDVIPGGQAAYARLFTPTPASHIAEPLVRRNTLSYGLACKLPWLIRKTARDWGMCFGYDRVEGLPLLYDVFGVTALRQRPPAHPRAGQRGQDDCAACAGAAARDGRRADHLHRPDRQEPLAVRRGGRAGGVLRGRYARHHQHPRPCERRPGHAARGDRAAPDHRAGPPRLRRGQSGHPAARAEQLRGRRASTSASASCTPIRRTRRF